MLSGDYLVVLSPTVVTGTTVVATVAVVVVVVVVVLFDYGSIEPTSSAFTSEPEVLSRCYERHVYVTSTSRSACVVMPSSPGSGPVKKPQRSVVGDGADVLDTARRSHGA